MSIIEPATMQMIKNIIDGTTPPERAIADEDGKNFKDYYALKSELSSTVIETTITDLNSLPLESGTYKNESGFTTNIPESSMLPNTINTINQEVYYYANSYFLIIQTAAIQGVLYQRVGVGTGINILSRGAWGKIVDSSGNTYATQAEKATKLANTTAIGSSKVPVYFNEAGEPTRAADVLNIDDMYNSTLTSVQIGEGADATQNYGVVIGNDATTTSTYSTVVGDEASASGADATAIGAGSTATSYGTAVGKSSSAGTSYSVALGRGAKTTTSNYAVQLGAGTNTKACVQYRGSIIPHYARNTLTYGSFTTEESSTFYAPKGMVELYGHSSATNSTANLKIVWGAIKLTGSSSSATTVSMGVYFTSEKTYSVFVSGQGTGNYNYSFGVEPYSSSSFKIKYGSSSAVACRWVAIGY